MRATLIKIDRNGSKHWEGWVPCDRCGGNGGADAWKATGWTCWKCGGTGTVLGKWIERTPEYQAKLDARREAKAAAAREKWERENAERMKEELERKEAERLAKEAEEARIKAEKAISQFVGQVGEKITIAATYDHSAWFTAHLGWKEERVFIHTFKDDAGNVLVWKTSSNSLYYLEEGDRVQVSGTVKEHSEYKGEKQTVLTRCKVKKEEQ